jgi:hypothetical protein
MAKWINNFQTARVGGKEVMELFLSPFILNDGTDSEYALGIGVSKTKGINHYRHTGGHEAFATQLDYFPDHNLGIVTISNFGGRAWLATDKVYELFLKEHMKDTELKGIKLKIPKEFAGTYVSTSFNRVRNLTIEDDTLVSDGRTKLIPLSKNTFGIEGWDGKFQINKLSKKQTELIIDAGGKTKYIKVEAWEPSADELKKFEGDYWSKELETVYHLKVKEEELNIQHRWIGDISLKPVSKDFFSTNFGIYVKFTGDSKGEINGLSLYSGRTLDVYFKRK